MQNAADSTNQSQPFSAIAYRPDIDGLRAIAVSAVIGGHVGLPGFSGGFVGVDIFFVISGYLIIGLILQNLRVGTFSFTDFWAKRALRIIPPMLAMLLVCSFLAPVVFVVPGQFKEFGNQVFYSALMLVNFYFLFTQDYFDTEAILKPLLHMWSLAVEEQFYLVAPLALFGFWRLKETTSQSRRWLFPAIAGLAFFGSLIACIVYTEPSKNIAFYVVLCRAWEFIAGGAMFYLLPRAARLPKLVLDTIAVLGLLAILISVIYFDESQSFPSFLALLPVAGASMVIISGIAGSMGPVARLLAIRPIVAVGLVSYGWYLWHWPLLSFSRIYNFGNESLLPDIGAVSIGFLLAVASYFLIERPSYRLRRLKLQSGKKLYVVAGALVGSAAISVAGITYSAVMANNIESSIPAELRPEKNTKVMAGDPCWIRDPDVISDACIDRVSGKKVAILVGDSHARMLYPALKPRVAQNNMELIVFWRSGCSPFGVDPGNNPGIDKDKCEHFAERGLLNLQRRLKRPPAMAFVGGYWSKLMHGQAYADFVRHGETNSSAALYQRTEHLIDALAGLVGTLNTMNVGQIFIVGPSAEFVFSPVDCILRADHLGIGRDYCEVRRAEMETWLGSVMSVLQKMASSSPKSVLIDTADTFCNRAVCRPNDGDVLFYADNNHVSAAGAEEIFERTYLHNVFGLKVTSHGGRQ